MKAATYMWGCLIWAVNLYTGAHTFLTSSKEGGGGLGSKCFMWVAESEHVLIWKHALLKTTFLSFPCQHKYLSKPVSGAPSLTPHCSLGGGRKPKKKRGEKDAQSER